MTSAAKKISTPEGGRFGFTLLEIVIALGAAALILGSATTVMVLSSDQYNLKKASREVEALAKRARSTAILTQVPYALEFTPGMVRLMPWGEAIGKEAMALEVGDFERRAESAAPHDPVRWELSLDNGMRAQLRRWDSDEWIVIAKNERHLWRFDPDGLCEPIGLELWLEKGRITMEFNPLTGAIDPSSYIYE